MHNQTFKWINVIFGYVYIVINIFVVFFFYLHYQVPTNECLKSFRIILQAHKGYKFDQLVMVTTIQEFAISYSREDSLKIPALYVFTVKL